MPRFWTSLIFLLGCLLRTLSGYVLSNHRTTLLSRIATIRQHEIERVSKKCAYHSSAPVTSTALSTTNLTEEPEKSQSKTDRSPLLGSPICEYHTVTIATSQGGPPRQAMSVEDLTFLIQEMLETSGMKQGVVNIVSRHTTTAITINERESRLAQDMADYFLRLAPPDERASAETATKGVRYKHNDIDQRPDSEEEAQRCRDNGWDIDDPVALQKWRDQEPINAHSHLLSMLLGSSESIPVVDGKMVIGQWQSIMLVDLDGPRDRSVGVQFMGYMIMPGCRHLVLIGDHKQLGPHVAGSAGTFLSLFERLTLPDTVGEERKISFRPYFSASSRACFVDVKGGREERVGNGSWFNLLEIERVMDVLNDFLVGRESSLSASKITILTFYRAQQMKITERLKRLKGASPAVCLVDGFQGRENDVVIVSTVRSSNSLGFCDDQRRVNLLLTRAKCGLIVLGSCATLERSSLWSEWLREVNIFKSVGPKPPPQG